MSYTDSIKNEILSVRPKKFCCRACELCGIILFIMRRDGICYSRNAEIIKRLRSLVKKVYDYSAEIEQNGAKHCVELPDEIISKYDFDKIGREQFICENCIGSFLRGAFLAVGS